MMPNLPVPSHRALNAAWAAVLVVLLVGGIILTLFVLDLAQSREVGQEDRAELRELVETQAVIINDEQAKRRLLQEQVEDLGEEPVVDDAPTLLSPLPALSRPPTFTQVLAAVETSIDAALRSVCGGDCTGAPGADGQDGSDSTVPGPQGPAGADSTVPGPRGPAGADSTVPGPRGPAGENAPRPTFIQCQGISPATFTFGYSDGTTITVECGFLEPANPPDSGP